MLFCLLSFTSCKDSEDTPDKPDKPIEETDTVKQKVRIETPHVDVETEGGKAYVFIKAYSSLYDLPQLNVDASWVREAGHDFAGSRRTRAIYHGFYDMVYVLDVDKNEGLGRVATLTFNYYTDNGKHLGEPVKVTLHQWPRNFKFAETIHVNKPGQLPILMGGNAAAWSMSSS